MPNYMNMGAESAGNPLTPNGGIGRPGSVVDELEALISLHSKLESLATQLINQIELVSYTGPMPEPETTTGVKGAPPSPTNCALAARIREVRMRAAGLAEMLEVALARLGLV